ncbi:GntR family transcriptional regulator [Flavicella sediminum]|uniref:GntR family transcriptional regulator n=1 Tax=Flavicella sediminum TaxID=2585141 RepID=UPI00111DA2AF|nr:GntR family transcriptional regulator [Flavicella sediminum]
MIDQIRLDVNSRVPKYIQIIDSIMHNISNGNTRIGDKIPSINRLSEEFYLSRDTVERAYNVLKKRKVIVSIHGKGTYVAKTHTVSKLNVLFLVNKFSTYKMQIYNSFLKELGDNAHIDLHSYHCDEALFLELINKYKSEYDYYVIMPHFRSENLSHMNLTEKARLAISKIPQDNLVLLDNNQHELNGDFIEVYQDFEKDIYASLESALCKISKYKKLVLFYPKTAFYPYPAGILKGFMKFCGCNGFDFEVRNEASDDMVLEEGSLYITIEESDLVTLVKQIRGSDYQMGQNIGVISYNDTSLKQLLGITVVSADFDAMGKEAASMIFNKTKKKIRAPFNYIDRESA